MSRLRAVARIHRAGYATLNADLRRVFDDQPFWKSFQSAHKSLKPTGLFANPLLNSAHGFGVYTQQCVRQAENLISAIESAETKHELALVIRNIDRLSDVLCRVIDMSAFVRMVHPDSQVLEAAQQSHEAMFEYMSVLNTRVRLCDQLERAMQVCAGELTPEEKVVGELLLYDFKRSGIRLDPEARQKFVNLSTNMSVVGQRFLNQVDVPGVKSIQLSKESLRGMDPGLIRQFSSRMTNTVRLPTYGPVPHIALQTVHDEATRKRIWQETNSATDQQVDLLKSFLKDRSDLSQMMGSQSFGHYELQGKMMKTPEHASTFLNQLHKSIFPLAKQELDALRALKGGPQTPFHAWDRHYYQLKYLSSRRKTGQGHLMEYFSLGTVMQGLSALFQRIYGIRFEPVEAEPGEVWNTDIRKLDVISDTDGKVGVMYCDLFERDGKSQSPAHYTIHCSREITSAEQDEIRQRNYYEPISITVNSIKFQMPMIALICNFSQTRVSSSSTKCLLSYSEVETLFHEMGHAIHSMIGRTRLQNVSGTRCATDYVELPSVLMERFLAAPSVLELFARHHETDQPLPYEMIKAYLDNQRLFKYSEVHHQIKISYLDQLFHNEHSGQVDFNPQAIFYELEKRYGVYDDPDPGSRWFGQFGHLFSYGATYYCYLFDRAIADRFWNKLFMADPLNREAGERFKSEVLAWGGSRDPWINVSRGLDEPELESGDEEAILRISQSLTA